MAVRFLLLLFLSTFLAGSSAGSVGSAWVPFGTDRIEVRYSPVMKFHIPMRVEREEAGITRFYHLLLEADYSTLLNDLARKKDSLRLNDWMQYGLLRSSVNVIFAEYPGFERELIAWFLLSHAGFDTRLAYNEGKAFLYIHIEEPVYDLPMIEDFGKAYYYLPYPIAYPVPAEDVFLLGFTAMPGGQPLSFRWAEYPLLPALPQEKTVQLRTRDTLYNFSVTFDRSVVDMFAQQPVLGERAYFEFPMSPLLRASLIPRLEAILAGKTVEEAIEILLAFTRSSFAYKEDEAQFGRSKPMAPDELFFYPYSDCEDRAVLFCYLVKTLMGLPVVAISFADHISIGVATGSFCEASVQHAGRQYCICDPTGPMGAQKAGVWPKGYENKAFQIIDL